MKFQPNRFSLNFHHAWSYGYRLLKESVHIIKKIYIRYSNLIFFFIIISQLNVPLKRIRSYTEFQEETQKKSQNPMRRRYHFNESLWNIGIWFQTRRSSYALWNWNMPKIADFHLIQKRKGLMEAICMFQASKIKKKWFPKIFIAWK